MTLTASERETKQWGAADILRDQIDSSDYKSYFLSMLYLKRLSDRFGEVVERVLDAGVPRNGAETHANGHEFFVPPNFLKARAFELTIALEI